MSAENQSVEEMMDRLKKRFKAAGLSTKTDSFSETNMVQDETRCVTQLRTYVKLCKTMGATFVINEKARHEIFDAARLHDKSVAVLVQALLCLNLLLVDAQSDARKSKQITFEVYEGAFGKFMGCADLHAADAEFALNLVKFVRNLLRTEAVGVEIAKSHARVKAVLSQITTSHSEDPSIINDAEDVRNVLEQIAAAAASAAQQPASPLVRQSTQDEFQLLADGDLLGDDFNLVDDFDTPLAGNNDNRFELPAAPQAARMRPQPGYVPEEQLVEAKRTIGQYQLDIQALSQQLAQIQLSYAADQEVHRSFVEKLQESEGKHHREVIKNQQKIGTLNEVNAKLNSEVTELKTERDQQQKIIDIKLKEYNQMRTAISNQMDQARAHYLALQQEYTNVKNLNTTLQETTKSAKTRLSGVEEALASKVIECKNLTQEVGMWQKKCEDAQQVLVAFQQEKNVQFNTQNDSYQKLQQEYGVLVNQHQNLYALNETLKQQYVQLKMQFNTLQQQSSQNVEVYKLQAKIKALETEKNELITMTEVLLSQSGN